MNNPSMDALLQKVAEETEHLDGGDWRSRLPPIEPRTVLFTEQMPVVVRSMTQSLANAALEVRIRLVFAALYAVDAKTLTDSQLILTLIDLVAKTRGVKPVNLAQEFAWLAANPEQRITDLATGKSVSDVEFLYTYLRTRPEGQLTLEYAEKLLAKYSLEAVVEEI